MSDRQEIQGKLREFITTELLGDPDNDELTPSTNLLALGIIDSISMVSLRIFVERTFSLRLPDDVQPEEFSSIDRITALIERIQGSQAAPSSATSG
jgi:acyl carrier protein